MPFRSLFSRTRKNDDRTPKSESRSTSQVSENTVYAASDSSSRLPFAPKLSFGSDTTLASPPPRPSFASLDVGTSSRSHRSRPPPSKSAFFTAYAEHASVYSTESLPNASSAFRSLSFPSSEPASSPPPSIVTTAPAKASSRFFSWSTSFQKKRAKSKDKQKNSSVTSATAPDLRLNLPSTDSFNLKSFRHIRPPSPTSSVPRPSSNGSDFSQRISVSAFREAQSRRNSAGSSLPSSEYERSPRVSSQQQHQQQHHHPQQQQQRQSSVPVARSSLAPPSRSTPNLRGRGGPPAQTPRRSTAPVESGRRSLLATSTTLLDASDPDTDEDDSETGNDNEEDDYPRDFRASASPSPRPSSQSGHVRSAATSRPKAKSEVGHSSSSLRPASSPPVPRVADHPIPTARVVSAHIRESEKVSTSRSQSSLGVYKPGVPTRFNPRRDSTRSTATASSEASSSDDDAPLAALVGHRGPGSTTSHGSGTIPRKPLIDISSLAVPTLPSSQAITSTESRARPALRYRSSSNSIDESAKRFTAQEKGKGKEKDTATDTNLSKRLATLLQQDNAKEDANRSSVAFPARSHHRRASSDGHIRTGSRDSGTTRASGHDHPQHDRKDHDNATRNGPTKRVEDGRIVPTPIRQRDPPASFSVTSRPQHQDRLSISVSPASDSTPSPNSPGLSQQPRQRSSTMAPAGSPPRTGVLSGAAPGGAAVGAQSRQRSSTTSAPAKPFADSSPASSTGDSSSGGAPLTPKDGSDLGKVAVPAPPAAKEDPTWGSGVSGLGVEKGKRKGPTRRLSVNFEDDVGKRGSDRDRDRDRDRASRDDSETRRRERRRSEAKAAIELGNVINGPGPIISDDEDGPNVGRMSMMNPMMGPMNMGMAGPIPMTFSSPALAPMWSPNMWQQPQGMPVQMIAPTSFMIPPPADPALFAAHQRAMLYAKQTYQMAVAQQAMLAAGEEWERGSTVGGFSGSGSVMGGMSAGAGWTPQQQMFAAGLRPPFMGFGSSQSEYGGGGGSDGGHGVQWNSSRSVYGETFGRSTQMNGEQERSRLQKSLHPGGRDSGYFAGGGPPVPPTPAEGGKSSRLRTTSGPASVVPRPKKVVPPPSSWRIKREG